MFRSSKTPHANWKFFMFPVAFAAVAKGNEKVFIREEINTILQKSAVYSGTCPNQSCKISSILIQTGTTNISSKKNENFAL